MGNATVLVGDVLEKLRELPENSVHCVVTSPPYWGLRDYGTGTWEGGDPACGHKEADDRSTRPHNGLNTLDWEAQYHPYRALCPRCGARRQDQQIGLEESLQAYLDRMVEVFRKVRRVLHPSGIVALNMGDSYIGGQQGGTYNENWKPLTDSVSGWTKRHQRTQFSPLAPGLKPKDLCMMPFRLALALQADGWWLRSVIPWTKRNPLPESVRDRPTSATEYVFLLAKNDRYYWDAEAVRVSLSPANWHLNGTPKAGKSPGQMERDYPGPVQLRNSSADRLPPSGRNFRNSDLFYSSLDAAIAELRTELQHLERIRKHGGLLCDADGEPMALNVTQKPFPGAHFATFSPELVRPFVRAGSSRRCCPAPVKKLKLRDDLTPEEREIAIAFLEEEGLS